MFYPQLHDSMQLNIDAAAILVPVEQVRARPLCAGFCWPDASLQQGPLGAAAWLPIHNLSGLLPLSMYSYCQLA